MNLNLDFSWNVFVHCTEAHQLVGFYQCGLCLNGYMEIPRPLTYSRSVPKSATHGPACGSDPIVCTQLGGKQRELRHSCQWLIFRKRIGVPM